MEKNPENNTTEEHPASPTPQPAPKRRGRKRKQEITVRDIEITPPETVSRRGRPRKQINYFELANPYRLDDYSEEFQDQVSYISTNEDKKRRRVKREKPPNDSPLEDSTEQNKNNLKLEEQTEKTNVNGTSLDESVADLEASASTSTSQEKKYTYTGKTVKMLNTLFSLCSNKIENKGQDSSNNESITTEPDDNNTSVDNSKPPSAGKKRPYKKKKTEIKEDPEDDSGQDVITCAVCNAVLEKSLWIHHKQRFHNNLAWRIGDPPLDLTDQAFVMYTLNMLYKKKKPLYCQCGEVKKSVVGFLSHQATCQMTAEEVEEIKIGCEVCGKRMLPVSMTTHMKFVHSSNRKTFKMVNENKNNVAPLSKRGAAKKALKLIQNLVCSEPKDETNFTSDLSFKQDFVIDLLQKQLEDKKSVVCKYNCEFLSSDLEEIINHHEVCSKKFESGFICKFCLTVFEKLEDVTCHLESSHKITVEALEDDSDTEYKEKNSALYPGFLYTAVKKTQRVLYPNAFDWTYTFQEKNFSKSLFQNLYFNESDWRLIPVYLVDDYLPKMGKSCDVSTTYIRNFSDVLREEVYFKKFELFESEIHEDGKISIFCGGPISSLAWLPTPLDSDAANQVLAVSILDSPDDKYLTNENFQLPAAIQFWSIGPVRNCEDYYEKPRLVFNLAHNHGPVWHMEWCPSGCFDFMPEIRSRMGLLAITGSDSVVYIYSVPFFSEKDMGLYYKPKAVIKLMLQRPGSSLLGGLKYYPSKISWSKAVGHEFIVVGYTNGFVAIFNLKCDSNLLKYKDFEGVTCILPYKCFQAHSHTITACEIHHMHGGGRWLMTASLDRALSLWDLNNFSYPLYTMKKNIITDGFWLSNWLSHVVAGDEGSTTANVITALKQASEFNTDHTLTLGISCSTITSISGSNWLNAIIQVNLMGEIVTSFPHQVCVFNDLQKIIKKKRMLFGYTTLVDKTKSPEQRSKDQKQKKQIIKDLQAKRAYTGVTFNSVNKNYDASVICCDEPVLYHDADERYGVLFCDNKLESYKDFPESTATHQLAATSYAFSYAQPNQYPMTAINKVVFNPNRQASLYYATGYQIGFVRISRMSFLKEDPQIK